MFDANSEKPGQPSIIDVGLNSDSMKWSVAPTGNERIHLQRPSAPHDGNNPSVQFASQTNLRLSAVGPRIVSNGGTAMPYSLLLSAHITGGIVSLLSGTAAMMFRKGSRYHILAGKVFVISMLTMATGAMYLAFVKHQPNNIGGGIVTFYLITTAWLTAKRGDGQTSRLDWVALLIPLGLGILTWINGLKVVRSGASSQDGVPVAMSFFMGSVMLLAAAGDIRMLLRGGVPGAKRIVRHLWRMCFGLFIAAGSFFLGGANRPLRLLSAVGLGGHLSPAIFGTPLYLVLSILPLILLVFWAFRVWFTGTYERSAIVEQRTR